MSEWQILGRVPTASNAVLVAEVDGERVVYKPVAGEVPLWDFPDGSLANREYASYLIAEFMAGSVAEESFVPRTWLADGPHGFGMVQEWIDAEVVAEPVWVADNALYHEMSDEIRRIALFDVLVNNADRKAGHLLCVGTRRFAIDHVVTLHRSPKLRTVLWGWAGDPLTEDECALVAAVQDAVITRELDLRAWITRAETDALVRRCDELLVDRAFPEPWDEWRCLPWPLY